MGKKAENEIRTVVSGIVNYAIVTGKDIVIEELDFRKTKSEAESAKTDKGKNYNRMLHLFDYSRYKQSLYNCCFRKDVGLVKVNPAYTSKIAKQKYCNPKKLTIHQGASLVIARRGQGCIDKYIESKRKIA